MPKIETSVSAVYTLPELIEFVRADLAARGYELVEHINLHDELEPDAHFHFRAVARELKSESETVEVAATASQPAASKKQKQYYRKAAELSDEEKEARRAKWREQAQARRDARTPKATTQDATKEEATTVEQEPEEEVVAPSPVPFRSPINFDSGYSDYVAATNPVAAAR